MNLERDAAPFIYEGSRTIEVVAACGKQRFPFNVEVFPFWLNEIGLSQKREIGIVNLPSFGKRNALSRAADVYHPKQPVDRDRRGSDTSSMLVVWGVESTVPSCRNEILHIGALIQHLPTIFHP